MEIYYYYRMKCQNWVFTPPFFVCFVLFLCRWGVCVCVCVCVCVFLFYICFCLPFLSLFLFFGFFSAIKNISELLSRTLKYRTLQNNKNLLLWPIEE